MARAGSKMESYCFGTGGIRVVRLSGDRCCGVSEGASTWPASPRQQLFIVKFEIVVRKDGRVLSAHAVSGTPEAYKAGEPAVKEWAFKPYLVMGKPGSGSVSGGHSAIGIALHVELAIILMCGLKAESFVEPQSRVDFHDGQAHSLIETCGLAD